MNENMRISQTGINLIKKWEGVRLQAYWDAYGKVWTIGYGHTKGVYQGMTITQKQAEDFLRSDIESHVRYMKKVITVPLNQNQFDALCSFHFNLGAYILQNSTMLKNINARKWTTVAENMKQYCYSGGVWLQGLYNRRVDEANLFLTINNNNSNNENNQQTGGKIKMKTITLKDNVNLRASNSTNGKIIATLKKGSTINFDDIVEGSGYIWGVQTRTDSYKKGYIAIGKIADWGTIK